MRHAPGTGLADRGPADGDATGDTPGDVVERARALLAAPALVVVTGAPGQRPQHRAGAPGRRTSAARCSPAAGWRCSSDVPACALARAVRVRLPAHDPALLAEAVRSRVRGGLLLIDDLQWADPATVPRSPAIAAHCRVVVALRTPHRLPAEAAEALRAAAAALARGPAAGPGAAADLARQIAPGLGAGGGRRGGPPGRRRAAGRHRRWPAGAAAGRSTRRPRTRTPTAALAYAVATALADLTRPARTAMAALGLLGRPATAAVLGRGRGRAASTPAW